jgi:thioredoxin-related protein
MKFIPLALAAVLLMSAGWRTDFSIAKQEAAKEHKLILLKFSGSDWCVPCIRLEKGIFSQDTFTHFAESNLVMINADFPRQKKNQPDKSVIKQNEMLAEQYDKEGHFPYTVLLDSDGKVLKRWDGDPGLSAEDFIQEIATAKNAN